MLAKELDTSNQNIVNYLNRLKIKSLLKVLYAGKNAWYSLSVAGRKALEARYKAPRPDLARLVEEEQLLKERIKKEKEALKDLQKRIDASSRVKRNWLGREDVFDIGASALTRSVYSGRALGQKAVTEVIAKRAGNAKSASYIQRAGREERIDNKPNDKSSGRPLSASHRQKKK